MIAIITSNTRTATGELWEIGCAIEEGINCIGIWGNTYHANVSKPKELTTKPVLDWTWMNISSWLRSL